MKSGTPMARGFAFFPAPHGRGYLAAAVIFAVIALDQLLKFWVKTSFYLGEDLELLPFYHLRFLQNNGQAFGLELGSKLFLTGFRIVLVAFLLCYLCRIVKSLRMPLGYIVAVSLVTAGAFGNIVDCVLYGEIFTNPYPPYVAEIVPLGQGYGDWFQGLVVDMFYFPLFSFGWPQWLPLIGGKTFSFFDPVFNLADAAITVGMAMVILFYAKYIGMPDNDGKATEDTGAE